MKARGLGLFMIFTAGDVRVGDKVQFQKGLILLADASIRDLESVRYAQLF